MASEYQMYLSLAVFVALDVIIMTAWSLVNPFYTKIEYFPLEKPDVIDPDIEFLPQLEHCHSENIFIWYGTYICLKFCAFFLAFCTIFRVIKRRPKGLIQA